MTAIAVVIYHVFYMYNTVGVTGGLPRTDVTPQLYDLILYIIYPWLMPIFFIISGASSRFYLEKHTHKEYISSRTTKLLVPSTIGLVAFQFIQGYVSMALNDAITDEIPAFVLPIVCALSGQGVLWTVQMMWLFSLLLVLIRKAEKDKLWKVCAKADLPVLLVLVVPVWLSAQVLNTPVIVVYRFGLYGICFLLGYFVFSHDEVIERMKKQLVFLILPAAVMGAAFCAVYFGRNYADAPVYRTPAFAAYGWFACLAIIGAAAKYLNFTNNVFDWVRKRSFGLYVFHYLGISTVALCIAKPALLPMGAVYVISLAAGFAAGYGLNFIISRLPFFRWAVLGIKKKKEQ